MYVWKEWGWLDNIDLGVIPNPEIGYQVIREVAPLRPNAKVLQMNVGFNSNIMQMDFDIEVGTCAIDIPEMTIVPGPGISITVSDVDLWDNFGNPKVGKSYSLTDNTGTTMILQYHEHQPVSPGLSGQFRFEYQGIRSTIMDLQMIGLDIFATEELRKLHSDLASAEIEISGNCNRGYDITSGYRYFFFYKTQNFIKQNISENPKFYYQP